MGYGTQVTIMAYWPFVIWYYGVSIIFYVVPVDMESEQQLIDGQILTSDSAIDFLTTTLYQTSDTRFRVLRDLLLFLTSTISLGDRVITIHTIHLLMSLKKCHSHYSQPFHCLHCIPMICLPT